MPAGFTTLHILPHLNIIEGRLGGRSLWRNVVRFSPTATALDASTGRFSYTDVLLWPAAEALNSVIGSDTVVQFALSGEQGLSSWSYPREYARLIHEIEAISSRWACAEQRATRTAYQQCRYDYMFNTVATGTVASGNSASDEWHTASEHALRALTAAERLWRLLTAVLQTI